ncbi:hydroxyisourate hydrolase [Halorubrum sp. Ea8]|nr:hydroxyisourate hydrolase [Halorubrum sp. Ea8]
MGERAHFDTGQDVRGADEPETISQGITNDDGRLDEPLLTDEEMEEGTYQLLFDVSSYYERAESTDTSFLDTVPVRFKISDPEEHHHVPLLCSPGGYTTYRWS